MIAVQHTTMYTLLHGITDCCHAVTDSFYHQNVKDGSFIQLGQQALPKGSWGTRLVGPYCD